MALLKICKHCGVLIHRPPSRFSKVCEQCKEKYNNSRKKHEITLVDYAVLTKNRMDGDRFYKSEAGKMFCRAIERTKASKLKTYIATAQKYIDTHRSMDLEYKGYLEMKIGAAKHKLGLLHE